MVWYNSLPFYKLDKEMDIAREKSISDQLMHIIFSFI